MAKLLLVLQQPDDWRGSIGAVARAHKHLLEQLKKFAKGEDGDCLIFYTPPNWKVGLFKVQDDGVEELQSVDVHYHNENGERIMIDVDIGGSKEGAKS